MPGLGEHLRRRVLRDVAPDRVALPLLQLAVQDDRPVRHEERSVVAGGPPAHRLRRSEQPRLGERLDLDLLLRLRAPLPRLGREERVVPGRDDVLALVEPVRRIELLDPAGAVVDVERRRAPVEAALLSGGLDAEHGRPLVREPDAAVVAVPHVADVDRIVRPVVRIPAGPLDEAVLRDRARRGAAHGDDHEREPEDRGRDEAPHAGPVEREQRERRPEDQRAEHEVAVRGRPDREHRGRPARAEREDRDRDEDPPGGDRDPGCGREGEEREEDDAVHLDQLDGIEGNTGVEEPERTLLERVQHGSEEIAVVEGARVRERHAEGDREREQGARARRPPRRRTSFGEAGRPARAGTPGR